MIRSRLRSPDVGMSAGMKSSAETAVAATSAEAETGANTRVNELSTALVRRKMAKIAERTFLKERRRVLLRVWCILGRSPCELVTSAFASSQRGRRLLIAHRLRCTGLGATHGGNDLAHDASKSSSSKPRIRWVRGPASCFRRTETLHLSA